MGLSSWERGKLVSSKLVSRKERVLGVPLCMGTTCVVPMHKVGLCGGSVFFHSEHA